jgi:bis(5'-nucleosyl)-tetraphosphatase (symmetrical)
VVPQWDTERTLALAAKSSPAGGPDLPAFLRDLFGNQPDRWSDSLTGADRWRFVINTLTRIRFCSADGELEFDTGGAARRATGPGTGCPAAPAPHSHRVRPLSTLGLIDSPTLLSIDTSRVWGGTDRGARGPAG